MVRSELHHMHIIFSSSSARDWQTLIVGNTMHTSYAHHLMYKSHQIRQIIHIELTGNSGFGNGGGLIVLRDTFESISLSMICVPIPNTVIPA